MKKNFKFKSIALKEGIEEVCVWYMENKEEINKKGEKYENANSNT